MSKEFILKWYEKIPRAERNMPFIVHKGKVYTPTDIYNLALQGKLDEELQKKIEKGEFTSIEEKFKIGLERLRKILKNLEKTNIKIAVGTKIYTPKELLKEIEKGTKLGRQLLEAEIEKWEILWGQKK